MFLLHMLFILFPDLLLFSSVALYVSNLVLLIVAPILHPNIDLEYTCFFRFLLYSLVSILSI